jgi:PAS domain S-box-containing protein
VDCDHGQFERDSKGQPVRARGIGRDITERRRAEEALRESEERFRTVFEKAALGITVTDAKGKILQTNPFFEQMLGYSSEDMVGRGFEQFTHPDDVWVERALFRQAMEKSRDNFRLQKRYVGKEGRVIRANLTASFCRDAAARPQFVIGLVEDITEREQAEEALKTSEKRYRDLVDNALIGVYQSSLDGTILFANDSLMRMLEYSSFEDLASGKVFRFYRDAHDRALFINLLKADGKVPAFEAEMVTKTGAVKTVLLSASLDGELLSGMVLDITERKKAEAAIRSAKDRLQLLSRRLLEVQESDRRMLARELHDEIGQMLTAAKIDLEVVRRSPLQENLAARLDSSVATLDQCLRQVRNLSLSLRPSMLDDLGLVAALRWQLDHLSQRVGFHAQLIADEVPGRFHPDIDTACFRIVQEALTNVARHAEANNVEVELRVRGREILVSVRDDGGGFDVERALADASHGTTLGILGMQERVTLLDGKLEITSAGKLGTTVSARFPLRLAESQE